MQNRPLLLILACLALGGLVWLDNRPAKEPARQAAAPDPALQVGDEPAGKPVANKQLTDAGESAPGDEPAQPAADDNGQPAGASDGQTAGGDSKTGTGDEGLQAAPPESAATEEPSAEPHTDTAAAAPSGNPLASLDKLSLKDWVERPLFAPSRKRPPPSEAAAQGPATLVGPKPQPPSYELLGVIRDRGNAIALLRKKADGTSFRVQAGDMLGGWQVSKVEPRAVTLVRGDGTSETVSIFRQ